MEQTASLLPDLANPPKVRRKRAPKHDFKDGNGKVFAHHHDNGGGWVADTAYVAPTATVNRTASVFGFARVNDTCSVEGRARVYGQARLYDSVLVRGDAQVHGGARLCDNVSVSKFGQIFDRARLSGNTRVDGNVRVYGHVVMHNTRCINAHKTARQEISGTARLNGSHLYGLTQVTGAAICENTSLQDAYVCDTAFLINSRIATSITYDMRRLIDGTPVGQQLPDFFCRVIGAKVIGSQLDLGTCVINPRCVFHNCRLSFHAVPLDLFTPNDSAYYIDVNASNTADVRPRGAAAPNSINQPPAQYAPPTSVAAALTNSSQRRILRLETTE
jgi:carbonic anhydrase/acetyltransferase-like protein (isoleucine patch superfamily)